MDQKEIEAWKRKNAELQHEYQRYLYPNSPKDKEAAARRIQEIFEWGPFAGFISNYPGASPYSTSRYGLDYVTEKCIDKINRIANEIDINQ
jgi:hypothetical protein